MSDNSRRAFLKLSVQVATIPAGAILLRGLAAGLLRIARVFSAAVRPVGERVLCRRSFLAGVARAAIFAQRDALHREQRRLAAGVPEEPQSVLLELAEQLAQAVMLQVADELRQVGPALAPAAADLDIVGLHHAAEPKHNPAYNQAVPLWLVARDLAGKGARLETD